jgi:hypothetical protein
MGDDEGRIDLPFVKRAALLLTGWCVREFIEVGTSHHRDRSYVSHVTQIYFLTRCLVEIILWIVVKKVGYET